MWPRRGGARRGVSAARAAAAARGGPHGRRGPQPCLPRPLSPRAPRPLGPPRGPAQSPLRARGPEKLGPAATRHFQVAPSGVRGEDGRETKGCREVSPTPSHPRAARPLLVVAEDLVGDSTVENFLVGPQVRGRRLSHKRLSVEQRHLPAARRLSRTPAARPRRRRSPIRSGGKRQPVRWRALGGGGRSARRAGSAAFCVTDAPRPPPGPRWPLSPPAYGASGAAAAASALPARPTSARPAAGSQWGRTPRRERAVRERGGPLPPRRLPARRRRRRGAHNVLGAQPARPTPRGSQPRAAPGAAPLCSPARLHFPAGAGRRPATPRSPSPASTPTAAPPPLRHRGRRGGSVLRGSPRAGPAAPPAAAPAATAWLRAGDRVPPPPPRLSELLGSF